MIDTPQIKGVKIKGVKDQRGQINLIEGFGLFGRRDGAIKLI